MSHTKEWNRYIQAIVSRATYLSNWKLGTALIDLQKIENCRTAIRHRSEIYLIISSIAEGSEFSQSLTHDFCERRGEEFEALYSIVSLTFMKQHLEVYKVLVGTFSVLATYIPS